MAMTQSMFPIPNFYHSEVAPRRLLSHFYSKNAHMLSLVFYFILVFFMTRLQRPEIIGREPN
jgi:hypothetical protein